MKRSFLTAAAAVAVFSISACGETETVEYIEPVEEVVPAPAPVQPMPVDSLVPDTTVRTDTTGGV